MLGEKFAEEKGKIMVERVLPSATNTPTMESTFVASGVLLGLNVKNNGTFQATLRPDGSVFGEAQGIVQGQDGSMATWRGQGVGLVEPSGAVKYRGAIYYATSAARWSRLNKIAGVFECDLDAAGNLTSSVYEWR